VTSTATLESLLADGLHRLGLPAGASGPLLAYLALLVKWNATYNLTAVRDPAEMVVKHLLDSLVIAPFVGERLADVGTGPGLPGIPLALVRPDLQVSLIESAGKKARFMREAVRTLGLGDRVAVHAVRAEQAPGSGSHDCLTARAFGTLAHIIEVGGHLLVPGGRLLAMKGRRPDDELAALPAGWRHVGTHPLTVPGLDAERHLVIIAAPG
jgi:16S rRNA (guanine527-N7)-methyltransferase